MEAIEIFKCLLTDSMDSPNSQAMVSSYIMDLVAHMFLIMVRLGSSLAFLKEYSDLLFMALVFVKNLKTKFSAGQLEDNVGELLHHLMASTRKLYHHYS
jgi:hypothetical protein